MGTHDGHRQRLKTEFLARPDSFPDHKLLELLLFYANPRSDTNPLAHELLDRFGSLAGVLDATPEELQKVKGVGEHAAVLREGSDITLVSYGVLINELLDATETLSKKGISAEVIQYYRISPLDPHPVLDSVKKTGRLLVLEDCVECGSVGQRLAAALAQVGIVPRSLVLKNLKDHFTTQGTVSQLRKAEGLDAEAVIRSVCEVVCHG